LKDRKRGCGPNNCGEGGAEDPSAWPKDRKTSNPEETDNVTTEANSMVRVSFMNFGHNCLHHRTTPLDRMVNETV
jgi:hypothetical protein